MDTLDYRRLSLELMFGNGSIAFALATLSTVVGRCALPSIRLEFCQQVRWAIYLGPHEPCNDECLLFGGKANIKS